MESLLLDIAVGSFTNVTFASYESVGRSSFIAADTE